MKIVCISDTHNSYPEVPDGDVIVHAGDFTENGSIAEAERFLKWFSSLPHKKKIFIAGNHEKTFQNMKKEVHELLKRYPSVIYLYDSSTTIDGLKFYGWPWTKHFGPSFEHSAFAYPQSADDLELGENNLLDFHPPSDLDILVTHSPPKGILDLAPGFRHIGSELLYKRLKSLNPVANVFGHVHQSYGTRIWHGMTFANVSYVPKDGRYPVTVLEIDKKKRCRVTMTQH